MDNGNKSDHLIMAEVFNLWEIEENRGGSRGKHFCTHNFLTRCTLFNLRNLKSQFSRYLYEMGFLNNMNYKQANFNMNSNNVALVKAVICSGLYPNIAIIKLVYFILWYELLLNKLLRICRLITIDIFKIF